MRGGSQIVISVRNKQQLLPDLGWHAYRDSRGSGQNEKSRGPGSRVALAGVARRQMSLEPMSLDPAESRLVGR
eukprot:540450-Prymnesium_polylepis.1